MELADYVTSIRAYNQAMANDGSWNKLIPRSTLDAWERAYAEGNYGAYNDVFPYVNWWDELVVWDMGVDIARQKSVSSMLIMAAAFVLSCVCKVNVVYIVLGCIALGTARTLLGRRKAG